MSANNINPFSPGFKPMDEDEQKLNDLIKARQEHLEEEKKQMQKEAMEVEVQGDISLAEMARMMGRSPQEFQADIQNAASGNQGFGGDIPMNREMRRKMGMKGPKNPK